MCRQKREKKSVFLPLSSSKGIICRFFLFLIGFYQFFISPFKTPCCRFVPSCSEYARRAFLLHGPLKGAILTCKRLLKCHPFGSSGFDPVPKEYFLFKRKGH